LDHAGLLKAHQEETLMIFSDEDSALTGDGCDFPKKSPTFLKKSPNERGGPPVNGAAP
jgi:hypothetical protein